jgi:hypothetical protein
VNRAAALFSYSTNCRREDCRETPADLAVWWQLAVSTLPRRLHESSGFYFGVSMRRVAESDGQWGRSPDSGLFSECGPLKLAQQGIHLLLDARKLLTMFQCGHVFFSGGNRNVFTLPFDIR